MLTEESKTQVFTNHKQWGSGLALGLELLEEGGITLQSTPAIHWVPVNEIIHPSGMAVDECGRIYMTDGDTGRIYRYDPGTGILEALPCPDTNRTGSNGRKPYRLIIHKHTLWVGVQESHRVQAFSRENFQLKFRLDNLGGLVDLGIDQAGNLYVLDEASKQIMKYGANGRFIQRFGGEYLKDPVALALSHENILYIIDREYNGFIKFTTDGAWKEYAGNFKSKAFRELQPVAIVIDGCGFIDIVDLNTGSVHQFHSDGSYLGNVPGLDGSITGLAVDPSGKLHAWGSRGIALPGNGEAFTVQGVYYSRTLDSRIHDCQWHRLALERNLPPKTSLKVYYYLANDSRLKDSIDTIFPDPKKSLLEKADLIDGQLPWIGPAANPPDMLFNGKGRYLWLKLVLATANPKAGPTVNRMRVYYPRISYLRYLPAIYQDDPLSKDFLERFLAIFETVFGGLEAEIGRLYQYFDPRFTPPDFLLWLASWLNLALEEDWPDGKKRRLIEEAPMLYRLKGTPAGISRWIEFYTGKKPLLLEHFKTGKPVVLGGEFRVGINSVIVQTPLRGFRLGDDSILGRVLLRDTAYAPEDSFLAAAYRFTVMMDLTHEEFSRYQKGLKRILDEQKPAHTMYSLRLNQERFAGPGTYIGVNSRVADYRPVRIGTSVLGACLVAYDEGEPCGKVEQRSKVGVDTFLT